MRLDFTREVITEGDDTIRDLLADVPVAPLLAAVAHLTGECDLLREDIRPDPTLMPMPPDDGDPPATARLARALAAEALIRFRDRGCAAAPAPDSRQLRALIAFVLATTPDALDDDYLRLLQEELALNGADLRAPDWRVDEVAPSRRFTAAVIGAGMSGIVVAHRLRQAGVEVQVFEKNPDVGGTWFENVYPGCRVDVPNHVYSYSFAQTSHWPHYNSTQPVLLDYFRTCAHELGVADVTSFGTEVVEATWDDDECRWSVRVRGADGAERIHRANIVVSAVGQLNRPLMPAIEGIDTFGGRSFHSARWNTEVDLTGKRVAVIGTGASAVQFIPWIAERARHLTVHQRTPAWLLPVPNYMEELPPNVQWVLRHVPPYARWDRLSAFARLQEGMLLQTVVDPEWDRSRNSVSAKNDLIRQQLTAFYEAVFPDPELRAKVLPTYPFGSKRMILDNGLYARTLQRPNVTLETGQIAAVTPNGIRMADGRELAEDVIIYGTGFQASKFLTPMRVVGAGGTDLHEHWGGDARAYLGITIPHFPNLFLMYGPNTNIVVNGSITFFSECAARYITDCVRMLLANHARSMACRTGVHDAYNQEVDNVTNQRAWGVTHVHTWYRNEVGRIAQNWPFNLYEYWRRTRVPNPEDFIFR
jgi:4-hydroxyacetophenone monooxygenase